MITESSIYWILTLDNIITLFGVFTGVFAVFFLGSVIAGAVAAEMRDDTSLAKKLAIASFTACMIFAVALTFIPSTKQMAMIKVIPAIANSEIVGEMSADAKEIYKMGINAIKESLGGVKK